MYDSIKIYLDKNIRLLIQTKVVFNIHAINHISNGNKNTELIQMMNDNLSVELI